MQRCLATIVLAAAVGVLVASCKDKSPTPPKRTSSAVTITDPVNALPVYYAVSQSKECQAASGRGDVLNDSSWRPDAATIERLDGVRDQIDLVIAATKLPRCDRVVEGALASTAPSIDGSEIGVARSLLRVEIRRYIAAGTHDEAARCVAALCRMAVQVRSRDGIMESTVQSGTMSIAISESTPLYVPKMTVDAREDLLDALEQLDKQKMYEGPGTDELYQSYFKAKKLKLSELLQRFRAEAASLDTAAPTVEAK